MTRGGSLRLNVIEPPRNDTRIVTIIRIASLFIINGKDDICVAYSAYIHLEGGFG
jgi:hypothetical protein